MVADALVYHPAVAQYGRFVATTVGRDKALRTVQYASRFLAWYTYRTNHSAETVALFEGFKKNFSIVRKAMRIGKFVEHFKAAAVAADNKSLDPVLRRLAITRQLGYAIYMLTDSIGYLHSAGIRKSDRAVKIIKQGQHAWLVGITCNILSGVYLLFNLDQAEKRVLASSDAEKKVELKKIEKSRKDARKQLIQDLCDFTLPVSTLGYINLDEGVTGLAGTISSLIGLSSAWKKVA